MTQRNRGTEKDQDPEPKSPVLLPLTPEYRVQHHGLYFSAIEEALTGHRQARITNIALTGSYGVGKSSILQKVADEHRGTVVTISLSTLGFADEPTQTDGVARTASTKTNRIQREVVKQLLYSTDPVKMPGSRYRRITRFRFGRELALAGLIAFPISLVSFLAGWSGRFGELIRLPTDLLDLSIFLTFVILCFFVLGVRKVLHNRIHIAQVSAGDATIALSKESPTFFDEYLDEIVYFFENTKIDLVIFEDIDRFDDPHIFETLRALNTLLNCAKQLRGRNVRFIYAIKDSIFDELGKRAADEELGFGQDGAAKPMDDAAEAEIARSNRTKFFDLVIPIVPFITHRSARDLLKSILSDLEQGVTNDLVDLAARHVADMRLLKNIRNEFAIFRQRIIVEGSLDLSDDGVLAMVLYKSTHLSDFELIKLGKSQLDLLYADSRELVNVNIASQRAKSRKARIERAKLQPAAATANKLGDALDLLVKRHLASIQGATGGALQLGGDAIDDQALRKTVFWEQLAAGASLELTYVVRHPSYGRVGQVANLTKEMLAEALAHPIDPREWGTDSKAVLDERVAEADLNVEFLKRADMSGLAGRKEFLVERDGEKKSFDDLIEDRLNSELARQLVRNGYIDRNFTLYTSTYYAERVSAEATNFILKNVDPNLIDMNYELSASDVDAILRERGLGVLDEKAAYNLSILDCLLARSDQSAGQLVGHLVAYGDDERELLMTYLESGGDPAGLVRIIASQWARIFWMLIDDLSLDDAKRLELVNTALGALSAGVTYSFSDKVRGYFEEHANQLPILISSETSVGQAKTVAHLFSVGGIRVGSLAGLGANVVAALVHVGAFAVNRSNLELATGRANALALDEIRASHKDVYQRVIQDLSGYLTALQGRETTIAGSSELASILVDIDRAPKAAIDDVILRAAPEAFIDDLTNVDRALWSALAQGHRVRATFENVVAYVEAFGVDGPLGALLADAEVIEDPIETDEDSKLSLAIQILEAAAHIPSGAVRSNLVKSLNLADYIGAASVPIEAGELVGCLIYDNVIEDSPGSFARLAPGDWAGREYAIRFSSNFGQFMTPDEVPVNDIGRFLASEHVSANIKRSVLARLPEFSVGASRQVLCEVADYALQAGVSLALTDVARMANEGVDNPRVVALLQPLLASLSVADIAPIMSSLGGEYAKLAGRTGKRPRFEASEPLRALVSRLDVLGVVSRIDETSGVVRVNMRRP